MNAAAKLKPARSRDMLVPLGRVESRCIHPSGSVVRNDSDALVDKASVKKAGDADVTAKRMKRRTQEERTAETRAVLFEAAVTTIDRYGYTASNNASIADAAGISRGAITHHFGTRANFMAEVVKWVFEQETVLFQQLVSERKSPPRVEDWPAILWDVFSRPSGVAVMEILVASRSDAELAKLTRPMQFAVERQGAENFLRHSGLSAAEMSVIRLSVWAVRGMTMGQAFIDGAGSMTDAVALLGKVFHQAAPKGTAAELIDLAK